MPKTRLFGAKSCSERHGHARRQTERTMPPPWWNPDITGPSVFSNIPHVHRIDPKTGLKWNASWGAGRTAALLPPKRGVFHMKAVPRELNAPHTRPGLRRSASGIILGRAPQAHQGASWATPSSSSSFSRSTNPSTSTEWSQIRSDWISRVGRGRLQHELWDRDRRPASSHDQRSVAKYGTEWGRMYMNSRVRV